MSILLIVDNFIHNLASTIGKPDGITLVYHISFRPNKTHALHVHGIPIRLPPQAGHQRHYCTSHIRNSDWLHPLGLYVQRTVLSHPSHDWSDISDDDVPS